MQSEEPARGNLRSLSVEAGGRRLSATLMGAGEPLVLLETGFGAGSAAWAPVAAAITAFTTVCYYDRASRGASDPAPRPRKPEDLLRDLGLVIDAAAPRQPIVLVGQSFGGLIARLYAFRHPEAVAAVVLVDSIHEDQFDACGPLFPPQAPDEPAMLTSMRPFWTGGWRDPARNEEGIDMSACFAAGREITRLRQPVRVLTANTWRVPPLVGPEHAGRLQAAWEQLQRSFTNLSPDAEHRLVAGSGHFVQRDAPDVIAATVRELVDAIRSG